MMKTPRVNTLLGLFLLGLIAVTSACSFGNITAQKPAAGETVSTQPTPSPTPGYKPLKRISRDVIDSDKAEKKDKPAKSKEKK